MRASVLVLLALSVSACDSAREPLGSFSATLASEGQSRTVTGGARFERAFAGDSRPPCRGIEMFGEDVRFSLGSACSDSAGDVLRVGTVPVAWRPITDSTVFVSFYDNRRRGTIQGTGGTVEILSASPDRITGRFDIEAHLLRFDNQIDTTGAVTRITGTFDAEGYVYTDD